LTRPSILFRKAISLLMDVRVKPGHDK